MKQALLSVLERFGYVVLRIDDWSKLQQRLLQAEVAEAQRHPDQAETATAHLPAESGQSREQAGKDATGGNQAVEPGSRAVRRAQAWKRLSARLRQELNSCKEQLARGDHAGRIRDLEEENGKLWRRLGDLERYRGEQQESHKPYYL